MEDTLQKSSIEDVDTYARIVDRLATPLFMIGKDHAIIVWNKACEKLTGRTAKEMIGTRNQWTPFYPEERVVLADLVIDNKIEEMGRLYQKCTQEPLIEGGVCAEGWYSNLGGLGRYIFFNAALVRDKSGEIVGAVEILEDITQWRVELSKLRKAVETSGEAIFMTDSEGVITFVNKEFTRLYGYTPAEVIGKTTPRILKSGVTPAEQYRSFWERLLDKQVVMDEHYNKTKDGRLVIVESSSNAILNEEEGITGFLAIQKDITARKEAEAALREVKAKEDAILASIGDGVIATDEEGKVIFINHVAETLLARTAEEMIGKRLYDVLSLYDANGVEVPPQERPIYKALTRSSFTTNADTAYAYAKKSGEKFFAAITISPVFLNKKVTGTIEIFRDVTKEKELEKRRDEFISLASHQLRNPITAITWNLETLLDGDKGDLTDPQRELVERVYASSKNMVELVGGFLDVTRMEAAGFDIERGAVDIVATADSVIDELAKQIAEKKLTIIKKYGANIPSKDIGTKAARIILQNLLTNAVKYTAEGGRVELEIVSAEEGVAITVKDNGYGIPKEAQEKIFTKLFRADNVKEREPLGTGLGLYLVKSLVDKLGGRIWFESAEGKGTMFHVLVK